MSPEKGLLERHGAGIAALAGVIAALPAVGLPFLSDDWGFLRDVQAGVPWRTPFGYVRPLPNAWLWFEQVVFGASPEVMHAASAMLIGVTAAVLVRLVARLGGDARLAGVAGLIFALHPYKIETAAWIAARPDALCTLLALLTLSAHDRWLDHGRGIPIAALLLFEAALLSKEAALVLPPVALVVAWVRRSGRPPAPRLLRGVGALAAVALLHFLVLWPRIAGRSATRVMDFSPRRLAGILGDYVSATLYGVRIDYVEAHARWWFLAAIVLLGLLLIAVRSAGKRVPAIGLVSGLVFLIAIVPALFSFQARYLFLPSAAAATGLAAILLALPSRGRIALAGVLGAVWLAAGVEAWGAWHVAGKVSRTLMQETIAAAGALPEATELILVNPPHRVRGLPVVANFSAMLFVATGRRQPVRYAALIDLGRSDAAGLDRASEEPVRLRADAVEVDLVAPAGMFSGLIWPLPSYRRSADPASAAVSVAASVVTRSPGRLTVRIPAAEAPVESIWYWSEGHLHRVAETANAGAANAAAANHGPAPR